MKKKYNKKSISRSNSEKLIKEFELIQKEDEEAEKNFKKIKFSIKAIYVLIFIYILIVICSIGFSNGDLLTAAISFGIDLYVVVLYISKKTKEQFKKTQCINNENMFRIKRKLVNYMYEDHIENAKKFCSSICGDSDKHEGGYTDKDLVNIYARFWFVEYNNLLYEEKIVNEKKTKKNKKYIAIAGFVIAYFCIAAGLYYIFRNHTIFVILIVNGAALLGFFADDIVDVGNNFSDKKYNIKDKQSNLREEILNNLQELYLQGQLIDKHIICFEKLLKNDKKFNFDENSSI